MLEEFLRIVFGSRLRERKRKVEGEVGRLRGLDRVRTRSLLGAE